MKLRAGFCLFLCAGFSDSLEFQLSEVKCSAPSSYEATFEPRCARFIGRLLLTKIGPEGLRDQSVFVQGVYR